MSIPMNGLGVVRRNIVRADKAAVEKLSRFDVATIHEAMGRVGLMQPYMRPIYPGAVACGPAVTVLLQPGDNWMMHVVAEQLQPGDVVVAACTAENTDGFFGDLLATSFMGQAVGAWFTRPENATILLLATSLPQFFTVGFACPREAIPDAALALGRIFPADFAIDGMVRINQLGAGLWEVAHDWLGLWCLALAYFALAVISALIVKRGQRHARA